jgi:hypothetical protein
MIPLTRQPALYALALLCLDLVSAIDRNKRSVLSHSFVWVGDRAGT